MIEEQLADGQLPLRDVTVVDLTQVLSGPFASMMLADMGAEVIKIEAVGRGDVSRNMNPSPEYFQSINRNKRSVGLDLKSERGQKVAKDLIADADVFIENMKPGRTAAFTLSYEDVLEVNENIVYCSISGFGKNSPYDDMPALDLLIQAMSGVMSVTGHSDGPPMWSGLPSGDLAATMYAVQSVVAALYAREQGTIDSEYIEISMLDTTLSWLTNRFGYTFANDEPFPRSGSKHPTVSPFGVFECADGNIALVVNGPQMWADFCDVIDHPELIDDERFRTNDDRLENRDQLREIVEAELTERTVDEWFERLRAQEIPAGPINDTRSIWEDEHVAQRELRQSFECEDRGRIDVVDHPVRFANLETELETPPPKLGEHTDSVLESIGYSDDEIEALRSEEVVE